MDACLVAWRAVGFRSGIVHWEEHRQSLEYAKTSGAICVLQCLPRQNPRAFQLSWALVVGREAVSHARPIQPSKSRSCQLSTTSRIRTLSLPAKLFPHLCSQNFFLPNVTGRIATLDEEPHQMMHSLLCWQIHSKQDWVWSIDRRRARAGLS